MPRSGSIKDTEEVVVPAVEEEVSADPNKELFEGGPTLAQVERWKTETGCDVYVTSVTPERHIVWRTLTRFEYRRLVKNLEQAVAAGTLSQTEANMNNEEQVAEMCILFPHITRAEMSNDMAGIASLISQQVMEASGFSALEVRSL